MKPTRLFGMLTTLLALTPGVADAQWISYAARPLNLRAGPAQEYPLVARVAAGAQISVQGCLSDYRWCDVVAGPYRGWAYAGNIHSPYQGANVPVINYGTAIGIGIIGFAVGSYWDEHYRAHPWYRQRQHWIDRPHPGFRPPGPRPGYDRGFAPHDRRGPDRPMDRSPDYRPRDRGFDRDHRPPRDRGNR